jgi:hypothetical protein
VTRRVVPCGGRQLYLPTFYQQLAGWDAEPSHLELYLRTVADISSLIAEQDGSWSAAATPRTSGREGGRAFLVGAGGEEPLPVRLLS